MIIVFVLFSSFFLATHNNTTSQSSINPTLTNEELYQSPDWITAIGTIGSTIGAVGIATYSFKLGRENKKNKD